ncbi:HAD-IA family hydrolase [Thiomicrospira sp. R3]|uniref:HAD-IA family hydrolase n=1 Tax=Thiomicrospira sp. R3 TaxID=3035472 RepID=UPI00259BB50C|nr:HAD-IA family hydrolase [Thiomicrospira sp. R3]WFE67982.1 HAD-IA family hydrolase [Thiomicrospira sp. R3]
MASRFKVVIFDWDGTLMNSEARIVSAIQVAAKRCGLPVLSAHQSKQIIGLSLDRAIGQLYPQAKSSQVAEMAKAYTQHFLYESEVEMQAYEGAVELLVSLRQAGYLLAVATGKSRKGLDLVLQKSGFGEYFDITRTPIESASKPDPLMLNQILMHLSLKADQALMVGDTTFDMQMAQSIAMPRVAMSHGVHELERLQTFKPLASFDHLNELQAWLLED